MNDEKTDGPMKETVPSGSTEHAAVDKPTSPPGHLGDDGLPAELEEFAKDAPPEVRLFMSQMRSSLRPTGSHPLFDKFTPEHIDKFLEQPPG